MSTYYNSDFGIKMKYPSDWTTDENINGNGFDIEASFFSPVNTPNRAAALIQLSTLPQAVMLPIDSLADVVIEDQQKSLQDYKLIESVPVTFDGISGYKIISTSKNELNHYIQTIDIIGLKLDKATDELKQFRITFVGGIHDNTFNQIADEMLNSFRYVEDTELQLENVEVPSFDRRSSNTVNTNQYEIFFNYENNDFGIKMKYPSDWMKLDLNNEEFHGLKAIASFNPLPSDLNNFNYDDITTFLIYIKKLMTPNDLTLTELKQLDMDTIRESEVDVEFLDLSSTIVDTQTANKIVYTSNDEITGPKQTMKIDTIKNGMVYSFEFFSSPEKVTEYNPTVEKIIDSIDIIPLSSS
jgi:hypothetical protein